MRISRKIILVFLLTVLVITAGSISAVSYIKKVAQAYTYGYPLVLMELTRQLMTEKEGRPEPAINHFTHVKEFPDHTFRNVVRPNNDTLYSIAWLDLSKQPLILTTPNTHGRYYILPLMDAWTNVFASVGKRSHGTEAGEYVITGPDWQGMVPAGLEAIQSPTNMVWIIGRTQTNGVADIESVSKLQSGYTLTSLERWKNGNKQPLNITSMNLLKNKEDPNQTIESFTPAYYFNLLAELMAKQPAPEDDKDMVKLLASLGIVPGQAFKETDLNFIERTLANKAIEITMKRITDEIEKNKGADNGWTVKRDTIGNYGSNYGLRTAVALIGLGALPPKDATYPNTNFDSMGRDLAGEHAYRLHFAANETPPVNAFWSLTMYDDHGFLIDNPIKRYAIGDRDNLTFNEDNSLDIIIQHKKPSSQSSNWLPAPAGRFSLTMRLYSPKERFLNNSWKFPELEKI